MSSTNFFILPPPRILERFVECFRVVEYRGNEALTIKVSPIAAPGILLQYDSSGHTALESLATRSHIKAALPVAFVYGPGTEPSLMNFAKGPFTTLEVVLKPHALNTLFGLNASTLINGFATLNEFSGGRLDERLLAADSAENQAALLTGFLTSQLKQDRPGDPLVEESLQLIEQNIVSIDVKFLHNYFNISQRHFERRFVQTTGLPPHSYIRVKRFNEAVRLIKARQYENLTDIAYALDYYDQSHLIRDISAFSGLTPKVISRKTGDFFQPQVGYSFL